MIRVIEIEIPMRTTFTNMHTCTLHMHVFMCKQARTSSFSAASAPSDSSFDTALSSPFLLAICSAEYFRLEHHEPPCRGTYTHVSVPCANMQRRGIGKTEIIAL